MLYVIFNITVNNCLIYSKPPTLGAKQSTADAINNSLRGLLYLWLLEFPNHFHSLDALSPSPLSVHLYATKEDLLDCLYNSVYL